MGPVEQSLTDELALIAKRDEALAGSTLAAASLELARQLDGNNSATSKAACAKALAENMDRLHEAAPPEEESDFVDELKAKREARRAAA